METMFFAAKFAPEGLFEALAAEVAPFGVRAPMAEYAATVGATRSYFASADGRQPGDPDGAAAAIMTALDADEPPLRLVLGSDAVEGIGARYDELRAELDR